MKYYFKLIMCLVVVLIFSACSPQTNITVTTVTGSCANGRESAPYCMAVTMQNNAGGQNWISSINYPFTNVSVSVAGVSNIMSPATNSSMDPNRCTSNKTTPGGTCTFYLQLNQEHYPVGKVTPATVTIQYTVNNDLSSVFGTGGGTSYSYSFTVNENTNLYVVNASGTNNLITYNNSGMSGYTLESTASTNIKTIAMDNSSYGYLWFGTSQGIYWYGNRNTSGNTSYVPAGITGGVSNIFTSQVSPVESSTASSIMYGAMGGNLYNFTFSNLTWGNSVGTTSNSLLNNVNAVSLSGANTVLASVSQVFACPTTSSSVACSTDGVSLNGITDLVFATKVSSGFTWLYVATTNGVFAESGAFPRGANTWSMVTGANIDNSPINLLTSDSLGNIYAGGNQGNIWIISVGTAPTVASLYAIAGGGAITGMIYDNIGKSLFVTSNNQLYQCKANNCKPLGKTGLGSVVGLGIGSSIS
ncbi:MAG: hypothetical protein K2P99_01480 [Burkholderiales bacterium]|nr:hypothetical protein [Burkholderiales bacterium]